MADNEEKQAEDVAVTTTETEEKKDVAGPVRNKKRAAESDEGEDQSSDDRNKRANASESVAIKILIPNSVAGGIIGTGGEIITKLQADSGAKLKLSQTREFFPGTNDRIALCQGSLECVMNCLLFIINKVREDSAAKEPQGSAPAPNSRGNITKVSLPSAVTGMVIGRGGENIKHIQATAGCRMQVAPKEQEVSGERVVTIMGEPQQIDTALKWVVEKMVEGRELGIYHNMTTTYTPGGFPAGARGASSGARYGLAPQQQQQQQPYGSYAAPYMQASAASTGYAQQAYAGQTWQAGGQYGQTSSDPYAAQTATAGQYTATTPGSYSQQPQQQTYGYGSDPYAGAAAAPAGAAPAGAETTLTIPIPDDMVGALLGRSGKIINDFMQFCGARIKVSQKGEFVPGTTNRTVTITGTQQATQTGHYLVTQRIQEVQQQRASQPPRT